MYQVFSCSPNIHLLPHSGSLMWMLTNASKASGHTLLTALNVKDYVNDIIMTVYSTIDKREKGLET